IITPALAWRLFAVMWVLLSGGLTLRLVRSAWAVVHACRSAVLCHSPDTQGALVRAADALGGRPPELCTSSPVDPPALVTWGGTRLLLPASAPPRDDWYAVFCHELAHLVRRDGQSRLAVELVTIVLPWQPMVWLLRREFRAACEEACDDWAVAA